MEWLAVGSFTSRAPPNLAFGDWGALCFCRCLSILVFYACTVVPFKAFHRRCAQEVA